MKKFTCNIIKEPGGKDYYDLVDYASTQCKYFLLVSDNDKQLGQIGKGVIKRLSPYLFKMEMKSEWPGTVLLKTKVPVFFYYLVSESAEILKKTAFRLYQWQSPELPDDLCFLRSDESPWLVNIAHENDSYLTLSQEEFQLFLESLPAYKDMVEVASEI